MKRSGRLAAVEESMDGRGANGYLMKRSRGQSILGETVGVVDGYCVARFVNGCWPTRVVYRDSVKLVCDQ